MKDGINLHIYEGNGIPIQKRNCELPYYQSFAGPEKPENYIAAPGLRNAVNVALALGQPLLITGEPGTGNYRKFLFMESNVIKPLKNHNSYLFFFS